MEVLVATLNDPLGQLGLVPAVMLAANSFLKRVGMPSFFAPMVNLLVGGVLAFFPLRALDISGFALILGSAIIGLSAGGFYDLKRSLE